jgi:glutamate-5-semialdehyde dehydrogenase
MSRQAFAPPWPEPSADTAAGRMAAAIHAARECLPVLAQSSHGQRNAFLEALAQALRSRQEEVRAANAADLAREQGLSSALRARLLLTPEKVQAMARRAESVAALPDPLALGGATRVLPSGLRLEVRRVPLGLVGMVYESRPDVTVEAACLTVKAGCAAVLRGGREARETNEALARILADSLREAGLPPQAVQVVADDEERSAFQAMMASPLLDLVVPRGGQALIQRVRQEALAPVLETGVGNCHVYVHKQADLDMALRVVVNAKVQNPAVCNAAETLLVDEEVAPRFLPRVGKALVDLGVHLKACPRSQVYLGQLPPGSVEPAGEEDWDTEYLDLVLAVRTVEDLDEAIRHIQRHGTRHSEAIVTDSLAAAQRFAQEVDAAAVYVNASTRFTDGYEFGLGAEIGISTQKLHARGPVGLEGLTTIKYVAWGSGQVRGDWPSLSDLSPGA